MEFPDDVSEDDVENVSDNEEVGTEEAMAAKGHSWQDLVMVRRHVLDHVKGRK